MTLKRAGTAIFTSLSLSRYFSQFGPVASAGVNVRSGGFNIQKQAKCGSNSYSTKPATKEFMPDLQMQLGRWNVHYTQVGNGDNVVLGLPGIFGTIQTDYEPLISRFNLDKFTVVCWDPPGYGKSKQPQGYRKMTHRNEMEDAEAAAQLMENLGFKRYSLLAWSRGAITAIRLLIQNPGKVEKLITWGAPAFVDEQSATFAKMSCDVKSWPRHLREPLQQQYGVETFQQMIEDMRDYVLKSAQTGSFQIRLLMPQVKVPTLIIHGQKDLNCPPEHAKVYHSQIVNSKMEIWNNCSHSLHLEQPDKLVKRVEKFILQNK